MLSVQMCYKIVSIALPITHKIVFTKLLPSSNNLQYSAQFQSYIICNTVSVSHNLFIAMQHYEHLYSPNQATRQRTDYIHKEKYKTQQ